MIAVLRQRRVVGQVLFAMSGMAIIFAALLPLAPGSVGWPGPDWLTALTFAWLLRRPDEVPVLLIAAVTLAADALLLRPLGLGAALAVVATELARPRAQRWGESGFPAEWLRVAVLMVLMLLADRLLRGVLVVPATLAPTPPLGQDAMRLIATVAAYPVVVGVTRLLGLRRAAPGEMDLARP